MMDRSPANAEERRLWLALHGPVGLPVATEDPTRIPLTPDPERPARPFRDDRDDEMERLAEIRRASAVRLAPWFRLPRSERTRRTLRDVRVVALAAALYCALCLAHAAADAISTAWSGPAPQESQDVR